MMLAVANNHSRQSGIALVLVLWMLVLLTVIANSLVFSSRTELLAASNIAQAARAEATADAGIHLAMRDLLEHTGNRAAPGNASDGASFPADGLPRKFAFHDATVWISVMPESAKIDINAAPDTVLAGLMRAAGADETQASALVDAIADWRDTDDLRHPNGAERGEYLVAGRTPPANADFVSTRQLRDVLGMSDVLYERIEPLVTVHSHAPAIDTTVAPRGVLLALPGVTPDVVDAYVAQRTAALENGAAAPPFAAAQAFHAVTNGTTYSIQVAVELGDNAAFTRQAVVQLTGNRATPVAILDWRAPQGEPASVPQFTH